MGGILVSGNYKSECIFVIFEPHHVHAEFFSFLLDTIRNCND
jgi:hypothetical protein